MAGKHSEEVKKEKRGTIVITVGFVLFQTVQPTITYSQLFKQKFLACVNFQRAFQVHFFDFLKGNFLNS